MVKIEDWVLMSPMQGPPLPRFLGIFWPWIKEELPPGEIPPEEPPPEEPVLHPFTFGIPDAQLVTYEDATAWKTVVFNCTIHNPNDKAASETVRFMMEDRKYYYSDNGDPNIHQQPQVSTRQIDARTWTLAPGETRSFGWDGNAANGPMLSRPHIYCFSLKGKTNESEQQCVNNM